MATEWRTETCNDCGFDFERCWVITAPSHAAESTRTAKPTRDTTLCMCDAE
ncbi:hypothetical protein [Kitasatospora sp. NPDC058478]|uniref:hypothetical protein n=1 Tax=unclassified Kitasatospora TaxID=2633591 RepID=UPI003664E8EA